MRALLTLALATAVVATSGLSAQTRIKKADKKDVPATLKEIQALFDSKKFSEAITKLQKAMQIAIKELEKQLQSGHPKAIPQDFKLRKQNAAGVNPFGIGLNLNMPFIFEWRGPKGAYCKITIHRKSTLAKTLGFALKLAERDPNQEAIGYKEHKGVFKKSRNGKKFDLTVPLWEQHVLQGETYLVSEELFFKIFNQAYVDFVATTLGK